MSKAAIIALALCRLLTIVALRGSRWNTLIHTLQSQQVVLSRIPNQCIVSKLKVAVSDSGPPYKGPEITPLLDAVQTPADLKSLSMRQLKQLSHELRWETINSVSKVGGHLGSSLGVVELTVALHYAFNAPEDKIVWDVAHQAYPHKILTGRRHRMHTLRQLHGLSGFTKRSESAYDCFGAGHSSTSISAALGMSVGKRMQNKANNNCIAVIGDGAITAGMAYEAMNNAAYINSKVIVILNDNEQVSLPTGQPSAGGVVPAGALSGYTSRILTSSTFKSFRDMAKGLNSFMPEDIQNINRKVDEYVRGMATGGTLFEELGFYYVGPVDAHDLDTLVPVLENIRDKAPADKPILLHVKSVKGKGYPPAEAASDRYHGVAKFDVATGVQMKSVQKTASFTDTLAQALINLAEQDRTVCAITAAMPGGTGLDKFGRRFPKRCFDVGIAEQHAVTFAAGLAVEGVKPFVCIYSTFMQRALDQLIHDVALQQLPVRFVLDRAGLVGNDGATHHGTFDMSYIGSVPDIVVMAPADEVELQHMVETMYTLDHTPSVVRYPRGSGFGAAVLQDIYTKASLQCQQDVINAYSSKTLTTGRGRVLEVGKGRVVKPGANTGKKHHIALLSIGTRLVECVKAARTLESLYTDVSVTVADARYLKPLDEALVRTLAQEHDILIIVEENSKGGFGAHVLHFLSDTGLLDSGALKVRTMHIPDVWIEAGTQKEQYDIAMLNEAHIVAKAAEVLQTMLELSPRRLLGSELVEEVPASWPPSTLGFGATSKGTAGGGAGSSGDQSAGPDQRWDTAEGGSDMKGVENRRISGQVGQVTEIWALDESAPCDSDGSVSVIVSAEVTDAVAPSSTIGTSSAVDTVAVAAGKSDCPPSPPPPPPLTSLAPALRQVVLQFRCGEEALLEGEVEVSAEGGHAGAEEVCDLILESPMFFDHTEDEPTSQVLSASAEGVREKPRNASNHTLPPTPTAAADQMLRWEQLVSTQGWASAKVTLTVSADFSVAALQALLHTQYPAVTFSTTETALDAGKDWVLEVQRGWAPQVIGNLTVYLPWHNHTAHHAQSTPRGDIRNITNNTDMDNGSHAQDCQSLQRELVIEGGAAFGTGDHATTRLCGEWLQREVPQTLHQQAGLQLSGGDDGGGVSVLDYGCGSAILALCALRYGATAAAGVDVDLDALSSAHRNCQLNGLQVELFHTAGAAHADNFAESAVLPADSALQGRQFDLLVANILAPILVQLAPQLAGYTAPGGKIALSGVLDFQADAVMAAYAIYFEDVCVADVRDGWVLITGVRKE